MVWKSQLLVKNCEQNGFFLKKNHPNNFDSSVHNLHFLRIVSALISRHRPTNRFQIRGSVLTLESALVGRAPEGGERGGRRLLTGSWSKRSGRWLPAVRVRRHSDSLRLSIENATEGRGRKGSMTLTNNAAPAVRP